MTAAGTLCRPPAACCTLLAVGSSRSDTTIWGSTGGTSE